MQNYQADLKSMTGGECSYSVEFDHYDIVPPNIQKNIVAAYEKEQEEKLHMLLSEAQEKNEALKIWEEELMENLNELEATKSQLSMEESMMNSFLLTETSI